MEDYQEIDITLKDLHQIVYFIFMKYKSDDTHRQGTGAKRDYIGGFMDRWVNRISEFVVFNNLLEDRPYSVYPDYFLYDAQSEKNAPDLLGLQDKSGNVWPFVKFKNGTWVRVDDMPRVEIKTSKEDQYLHFVRDTQMTDDYYVFVLAKLNKDYLATLFSDKVFSEEAFKQVSVNREDFILEDEDNLLISPFKIEKPEKIGTVTLIGTYSREEFKNHSVFLKEGESIRYLTNAENVEEGALQNRYKFEEPKNNNASDSKFINEHTDLQALPVFVSHSEFTIIGGSNSTLYLQVARNIKINEFNLKKGTVKLYYDKMQRTSNWCEYACSKSYLKIKGEDKTDELIALFDGIASSGN